ncbi:hypothetical protein EXIGLDRAFT_776229 [Exidia glandulosa HHB12029]|uniref:ATP synthase subunit K, mitochondrial n=1 Tax=Exidia glandulosa HHB12029 TaxID=1314781 RepID=A0A165DJN7_EXIGL|nr:hypothetical protein EXIGLDRAFT_776229 [Exidia glandulosa HHB12029]
MSVIAGRTIPKYVISLSTFGAVGALAVLGSGGKKADAGAKHDAAPAFSSSSKDEEDFIKNFVAEAEKADTSGAKH